MANYLYNGIELPDIYTVYTPEIQKEYPFLYLTYAHIGSWYSYYLNISKTKLSYRQASNGGGRMLTGEDTAFSYLSNGISGDVNGATETEWGKWNEKTDEDGVLEHLPIWSNYDINYEDGTLYLAASTPIPVSAPQIDPLSLFLGWKAGNWVARQRGKA